MSSMMNDIDEMEEGRDICGKCGEDARDGCDEEVHAELRENDA